MVYKIELTRIESSEIILSLENFDYLTSNYNLLCWFLVGKCISKKIKFSFYSEKQTKTLKLNHAELIALNDYCKVFEGNRILYNLHFLKLQPKIY